MSRLLLSFALAVFLLRAGAASAQVPAQEAPVKAVPQTERKLKPERVDAPGEEPAGARTSARGERPERSARGARGRRDADRGARGGGREAGGPGHGRGH